MTILTALLVSTATACGGSQKEAEAPTDEPADDGAVNDEMLDLAEGDMPDDGFEEEGGDEAGADEAGADEAGADEAGADEMAE